MKIEKVRICNFRSYKDSKEVNLHKSMTIMIGKNESGKTNFLKALESIDPDYEYFGDDLCYYPDCVAEEEDSDIEIVTAWFQPDSEDKERLKEIYEELAQIKRIKVTRYFDDHYQIAIEPPIIAIVDIAEDFKVDLTDSIVDLKEKLDSHVERYPNFANSIPKFNTIIESFLSEDHTSATSLDEAFVSFSNTLKILPNQDSPIKKDIMATLNQLKEIEAKAIEQMKFKERILELIPSFVYFDTIDLIDNTVSIDALMKDQSKYGTFRRLLELSNLDIKGLADAEIFDRRFATEEASATITGMVNQFWTQEKVDVRLGVDGKALYVYVLDESGGRDPPRKRSDGFQWFLSFYINFMAGSKGEFKNTILLLDNPGVYLHPSGQKDLLKILEEISKTNQIIFTTHSPFLIDRKHLDRVRLVLKGGFREGTTIKEKFHPSHFDSLEPIRAAIGMTLGDALFGSKHNLIVEGYSDLLILEAMSHFCKKINKNYLPSKISIISVGSADKIPYFALLLAKEDLVHAILLDNDSKGRRVKKELIEEYGIQEEAIVKLDAISPEEMGGIDSEIEDLIENSFYNRALNEAYAEILKGKSIGKITMEDLDPSVTKQTKKYMRLFTKKKLGRFDKILVSKQIYNIVLDKACKKETVGPKTITNFSKLFEIINKKLR